MATIYSSTSSPPLVSGEVSATADVTLSTATTLLPGITTTLPIGTFLIWFSASETSNGTNATATYGLYVAAAIKTDSSRTIQPYDGGTLAAASAAGAAAINARLVLTTPSVVQVQGSSPGSVVCHQRTMNWLQVAF